MAASATAPIPSRSTLSASARNVARPASGNAIALPTSVYLKGADFAADGSPSSQTIETLATLARSLIELAERVRGVSFGPPPLAARV